MSKTNSNNTKSSKNNKDCKFGVDCTLFECNFDHKERKISNILCCKEQGYCFNGNRCLKKHVPISEFACEGGINCAHKNCRDAHPVCEHDDFCKEPDCLVFDFLARKREYEQELKKEQVVDVKEKKEKKEKKKEKKEKSETDKKKVPEKKNVSVSNTFSILEELDFPPVSSKVSNSKKTTLPKSFSQVLGKNTTGSKTKLSKVSNKNSAPTPALLPPSSAPKPSPVKNSSPLQSQPKSTQKEYTVVIDTISSKIVIDDLPESKIKARLHVSKEILKKSKLEWDLTFRDDVIEIVPKSELNNLTLRKESVPLKLKDGSDTITEMMNIDLPNDYDDILVRMHAISNWLKENNYSGECVTSYDSNNNTANATVI